MSNHRILYVEDHEDTRELVVLLLKQRNLDVITAGDICSAVSLAAEHDFDLYLLDTRLPDGSGIELCKQLRQTDSLTPIVFYSAAAFELDKQRALESGAQVYLTKPARNGELADLIAALIANRAAKRLAFTQA